MSAYCVRLYVLYNISWWECKLNNSSSVTYKIEKIKYVLSAASKKKQNKKLVNIEFSSLAHFNQ